MDYRGVSVTGLTAEIAGLGAVVSGPWFVLPHARRLSVLVTVGQLVHAGPGSCGADILCQPANESINQPVNCRPLI